MTIAQQFRNNKLVNKNYLNNTVVLKHSGAHVQCTSNLYEAHGMIKSGTKDNEPCQINDAGVLYNLSVAIDQIPNNDSQEEQFLGETNWKYNSVVRKGRGTREYLLTYGNNDYMVTVGTDDNGNVIYIHSNNS